ncbi:MAG: HDOD domain-containing protein [bacterium]|nr:HDOD domain-containing protein [bacterium]
MGSLSIEAVLKCTQLPSLPAIAAEVLELTSRPDVPIREIAAAVQNDQALAGKILKTVNSSYYGLSSPCPTIDRAMSYLGLNTVKSLVLGFSLIDSCKDIPDEGAGGNTFDLTHHWRRAIYSASAARVVAGHLNDMDPDEAFLAALMQDVGMLAMYVAAGQEYCEALVDTDHDNEKVIACEIEHFGFSHVEVGSELTKKWRLPESIIQTARHHHDPGHAAGPLISFVRCGGIASLMASVCAEESCERDMTLYAQRAKAWFGFSREEAEAILQEAVDGAVQLSSLFSVDTGRRPDLHNLLSEANEALVHHQIEIQRQADDLARQAYTDGLTGIANRKRFDELLAESFGTAKQEDGALTVLFSDADKFKTLNDTYGHQAGDAVLQQLATRLTEAVGDQGSVCRYGGEEFAAILPGVCADEAAVVAERCRLAVEGSPFDLREVGCGVDELPVTISVGVASREAGSGEAARNAGFLLRAADKAVYAAKDSGRNCVRLIRLKAKASAGDAPKPQSRPSPAPAVAEAAKPVQPRHQPPAKMPAPKKISDVELDRFEVLLVEDDALQQRMISMPLIRHPNFEVEVVGDGTAALKAVEDRGNDHRFGLILLDIGLPGMSGVEVVRAIRASTSNPTVPIVVLSASENEDDIREALLAGANAYITKQSICDDPKARILSIVEFWTTTSRAA